MKLLYFSVLICFISILAACNAPEKSNDEMVSSFVFPDERPFEQAHASTLVCLDSSQYLTAWFGGTREKDNDVGIWVSKGDGSSWSYPIEVAKIREEPHWNPVLFRNEKGEVILFFKVGSEIAIWETWYLTSSDNGNTWSQPKELVANDKGGRGPVRNKPIVLSNGDWIAGASDEAGLWRSFVDISSDKGDNWVKSEFIDFDTTVVKGEGMIQPTLWESANGNVHMLLRTSAGAIYRSDSKDYGKTWSAAYNANLPNPNSGIDLVKLSNGNLALLYNPDDKNWGSRAILKLAVSSDNGNTWEDILDVENGKEGDEYSYPAIVSCGDKVALTYTWNRSNVMFKTLKINN